MYLDDGIIAVKSREKAAMESAQVRLNLENSGFIYCKYEKCQWEPQHNIEWLGFQIDLCMGEFSVPEGKLDRLRSKLLGGSVDNSKTIG